MFCVRKNTFDKERMIKLSAVLGHPNMIGVKPIYNEFNLQRYIKDNEIVEFEITGVWGESMVWNMSKENDWVGSAGIEIVIW